MKPIENESDLTPAERAKIKAVQQDGEKFRELLSTLGPSREISLAMTKVDEAVMWALQAFKPDR